MTNAPRTLLQIHYHDRPCGVTQVMRVYARAFIAKRGEGARRSVLFCHHDTCASYPEFPFAAICSCPALEYREHRHIEGYRAHAALIEKRLLNLLPSLSGPVAVVAHNLFLCKNAALVSAFARVARRLGSDTRYRFFSVVHDLSEEGRVAELLQLAKLRSWGVNIDADRIAAGANARVIAVGHGVATALRNAGVPVTLLENPTVLPSRVSGPSAAQNVLSKLCGYCNRNGIPFDPRKPIFVYPSRTIARKNPVEAVALACLLLGGTLCIGPSGTAPRDRRIHDALRRLAARHSLPVITDIQAVVRQCCHAPDPIPYIYGIADMAISSSVAESYGYLLREPSVYGRPVAGRRPIDFPGVPLQEWVILYEKLPVPAEWITIASVRNRYRALSRVCFSDRRTRAAFNSRVDKMLACEEIDFALLDDREQIVLLDRLVRSHRMAHEWRDFLRPSRGGWPGLAALCSCVASRTRRHGYDLPAVDTAMVFFTRQFHRCLGKMAEPMPDGFDTRILGRDFLDPRLFRMRG